MIKTLTEQWKNGELATGWYFYKTKLGGIVIGFQFYGLKYPYNGCHQTIDSVKGVVAPVSYDEIKRLQAQLKEANEIISIYRCYDDTKCGKATEYCKKWGVK